MPHCTRHFLLAAFAGALVLFGCGGGGAPGGGGEVTANEDELKGGRKKPSEPATQPPATTTPTADGGSTQAPTTGTALLQANFTNSSLANFGAVTRAALETEFRTPFDWITGQGDLAIVATGDGNRVLRQRYVPSAAGSPVVSFPVPFPGGDDVWLSYKVFFEPGFQFVLGGKLPGLAGGTYPTGGEYDANGYSARLMWRKNGEVSVYAYHQDRPEKWGEDFFLVNPDGKRWIAPIGQWFTVRERIRMNSSGTAADGEVEVWINGERKLLRTGVRWRGNTNYSTDTFLYSSFYGGSDATWSPTTTTYAQFDDIKVGTSSGLVD